MARSLKIFMRGKSITLLQEVLRCMGYEIHDQKGLFGTATRDAVKSYQKQQGLKVTGIVDDGLLSRMQGGGVAPVEEKVNVKTKLKSENQTNMDALVRLLIKKEVFSQEEWNSEKKKAVPSSLI